MAYEQAQEQDAAQEQTADEAWREVGEQFEALGDSLSKAFRAAWERDETRQRVRSMEDGLKKMVDKVERAVKDASESKQGEELRTEAERTAETLRAAGAQTWQEARPQLLSMLTKINAELERFTRSLEKESRTGAGTASSEGQEN